MLIFFTVLFIFLFIVAKKKGEPYVLSKFLFLLYGISFLCSLILDIFYITQYVNWEPLVYFSIILILWIFPFNKISSRTISEQLYFNQSLLKKISIFFIVFSLITVLFYLFPTILLFNSDFFYARTNLFDPDRSLITGALSSFWAIIPPLYHINLILFFLATKYKWDKKYSILLFISSFSFPIQTLAFFGRDGMVLWILNFFILYYVFKYKMNRHRLNYIRNKLLISFSTIFIFLWIISSSRFGVTSINYNIYGGKVLLSFIDYMGQQPENFSRAFLIDYREQPNYFPTINILKSKFLGMKVANDDTKKELTSLGLLEYYNVFGFFLKKFIWESGKIGTLFISIFFLIIFSKLRNKFLRDTRLSSFIILYTFYQIPMNGVFYYRQGVGSFDIAYGFIIGLCLYLRNNNS